MGSLTIEVQQGDATEFDADVLALKYAQGFWGLDKHVANLLLQAGYQELRQFPPTSGEYRVLPSHGVVRTANILVVGTDNITRFDYASVRELGYRFLASLVETPFPVKHLAVTIHGVGFGLELIEAFRAQLLGMVNAIAKDEYPPDLEKITFIERNPSFAAVLRVELEEMTISHPAVQTVLQGEPQEEEECITDTIAASHGQIFISYARADESIALQIADDLIGEQFNIWLDQIHIKPGQRWDKTIQNALMESEVMLLILTAGSSGSDNVADEYHYFLQNDKTIIPILAGNFEMANMPYRLSRFQYIDFREAYKFALEKLMETLRYNLSSGSHRK